MTRFNEFTDAELTIIQQALQSVLYKGDIAGENPGDLYLELLSEISIRSNPELAKFREESLGEELL